MAVTDRHLNTIEDSIDSHPFHYQNQKFVYIFKKDGFKKTLDCPLDYFPNQFDALVNSHGSVEHLQVMKE